MSDIEDDGTADGEGFYKPSYVLIAIDTHPSMFVKTKNEVKQEVVPFKDCLKACYEVADSLIFTQNKRSWSPFAVTFALEDDAASFVNFNDNILMSIKQLKEKNELSNENLIDLYQRKGAFDIGGFLLFCKKKFKEISSVYYKRTIIFITNADNPDMDKNQRFAALNEAKNFEANDINFQLVTMNPNFNYKYFYNELFSVMKQDFVENFIEDVDGLIEKLSSAVIKRYYQRKFNFFPFQDNQKQFIKLLQKNFIQEFRLYNNDHVDGDGKPVKKILKPETNDPKTFQLKLKMQTFDFDLQEHFDLKNNELPIGYTLLHVSDRVTETGFVLTNPAVLEPDFGEDLTFFNSFWQYCVDKNKVLVCARKQKHLDKVRFVELIPKLANNIRHFIVKTIPFANEIKYPPSKFPVTDLEESSIEQVKVTNDLINKLSFDYDPKLFVNPSIASRKAFLRSKFLDKPKEDVEDVTLDNQAIDKQLESVPELFKSAFNLLPDTGKKRKAEPATRGRGRGRAKKVK